MRIRSPLIITFVIFSTPFFNPNAHTVIPNTTDMAMKMRLSRGEESISEKTEATAVLSIARLKVPVKNFQKYESIHPATEV